MSSRYERRLADIAGAEQASLLTSINRGLEKESLRINPDGRLAQTQHPAGLGSALTHGYITTDYSEALLEFITPVSTDIEATLATLEDIHRFTYSHMGDELLWAASMPCVLEGDDMIPVARYGSSNIARMKTVYRLGLGHRYGRLMQAIAGIHYNFSMPVDWWEAAQAADADTQPLQDYITGRYLDLIRNFRRWSWLLIYLYGASPAVCSSFIRNDDYHGLEPFDDRARSLHAPFGTALRMGDLGYQSNAQKNLSVCYNSLDSYIATLKDAIVKPHPDYVAIGIGDRGQERQLNTSLLQIENEFYSPIRPKRVTSSGETPLGALRERGIEYIEVRCIDVNPYLPVGIDAAQMRFLDLFLLHCLLEDSPECDDAERVRIADNMLAVVNRGREPGLLLHTPDALQAGVSLHRAIDGFTDRHPLLSELRKRFPEGSRRYAGILIDLSFDYFLSRHWEDFCEVSHAEFSGEVYEMLARRESELSEPARRMASRLAEYDVLMQYHHWETVTASAARVGRRLKRANPLHQAQELLEPLKGELERAFLVFYPELQRFSADSAMLAAPETKEPLDA